MLMSSSRERPILALARGYLKTCAVTGAVGETSPPYPLCTSLQHARWHEWWWEAGPPPAAQWQPAAGQGQTAAAAAAGFRDAPAKDAQEEAVGQAPGKPACADRLRPLCPGRGARVSVVHDRFAGARSDAHTAAEEGGQGQARHLRSARDQA
eukprot:scaffold94002_cov63-Phaeocystis_antarctica.AAC.2